ncbi:MAG: phenylalanine--tRNA ligase subunit beta [Longimicrobiales bacterium]
MNVSTRWLKDIVPGLQGTPEEISEHLALRGAPVEGITSPGDELGDIIIGRVVKAVQHPNADRLRVCEVDNGTETVQIVCGAPVVKDGAFYPLAPVGAVLPGDFRIKKSKIRGEVSQGMLCSAKELGLGDDHDGILELVGDFTPGASFVDSVGLDDATLDVEVTANRGDLLSHVGVARELASEGEGRVVLPELPGAPEIAPEYATASPEVEHNGVSVRIDAPDLCSRYLGAVIRGVKVGPSPAWLQERLRGAGSRPINNVVDATNYVLLELGQPMHAFDLNRLDRQSVIVRRAAADERTFVTLDDETREVTPDMLLICDGAGPVAIAGVMGGQNSEVDNDTTDVLLECALFEPKSTRATRRSLTMSTDASYRYERGVDPEGMQRAMDRCIRVILATAGGELTGPILDCCPGPFESTVVDLRLARIERVLGIPFESGYVESLITPLGFAVEGETDGVLHVRVPGFRSYDVTREVDLIEEVARTHGFDKFPETLGPQRPSAVPDHPLFQLEDRLRSALVGHGLFEAQTPAFCPEGEGDVQVANPLTTTEPFMRRAIMPSLIRRVEYNLARGNRDVRLFELGTSFRKAGSGEAPLEESHLAAVTTGRREPPHWSREDQPLEAWDIKALLTDTAQRTYGPSASVEPGEPLSDTLESGSSFLVRSSSGEVVGHAGRVAASACDVPVWAGELWAFELTLPAHPPEPEPVTVTPLPHFPASERDLALLVPDSVTAGSVTEAIQRYAGRDLEHLEIFDLYKGDGVPEGLRSLAFRLRFRSPTRTLKDKQVDKSVAVVLKRLEEDLGVEARG